MTDTPRNVIHFPPRFRKIDCQGERPIPTYAASLMEQQAAYRKRYAAVEARNALSQAFEDLAAVVGLEAACEHLEHLLHGSKHHG